MNHKDRRSTLKKLLLGSAAVSAWPAFADGSNKSIPITPLNGNVNHAVCYWTYSFLSLDNLCKEIKNIGFNAIDLIGPDGWKTLKKYNVECSLCNGADMGIEKGWNDTNNHEELIKKYTEIIPKVAAAGYKNLICFSGNRNGMDETTGLKSATEGIKRITKLAEKHNVVLIMELLNSKVDHKDYMCDNTKWGIELCKRVDTQNFKLLYDIYHMQIMEGDIIRTIKNNHQYFGHYHTAGNPGRNEIGDNQEINYPAVAKAIVETGFDGYLCQEFIPKAEDKIASLEEAIRLCDV